jgi:replicative DNA helicase
MTLRVPPHNLDAERGVLGAILIDNKVLHTVSDLLHPQYFYAPQHVLIYEAIVELYQQSKPVDVVTLTSVLKMKKKLNQIGGSAYLSELIAGVPTSAHAKEYAELVKETNIRREMITLAGELDEEARIESKKLEDVLDGLESRVFALSQNTVEQEFFSTEALLELYMQKADEYSKNPDALRGIPTGIKCVDKLLGGFHNSELIIVAARPAVGKSSFAFGVARHAAVSEKKAVAIFSLEMPGIQVIERLLSQQIGVDLWTLRMGKLTDKQFELWTEGAGKLSEAKIFIDETPGVNIMQLRSKARKLKLEHGLDMIIVDYLQLMQGMSVRPDNRVAEVAEISRSLKLLARELAIPVIALSQLNRSVESRTDHKPQLSDLRESGSIEQDADVVLFLNREKLYNPETDRPNSADIIVAKHRNGPTGQTELYFDEKITKFRDLD